MAMTDAELLDTFDARLATYVAEHPDCQEAELLAYAVLLQSATPGLTTALGLYALHDQVLAAMTMDRGDGLPEAGPTLDRDDEGDIVWKPLALWTVHDYRLNLAWWHRRPDVPAYRLAVLIRYGEQRWPGENLSRQPWPDLQDLPAWGPILVAEREMDAADAADDADDRPSGGV